MGRKSMIFRTMNEDGGIQVPFLLLSFFLTLGGFGVWGFFQNWNILMLRQLHLNRCVGRSAQVLAKTLREVEWINQEIRRVRESRMEAGDGNGAEAENTFPLEERVKLQDEILEDWSERGARWENKSECLDPEDTASRFPKLFFERESDDQWGPKELVWVGEIPITFSIHAIRPPRAAAAEVSKEGGRWRADWAHFRANRL